MTSDTVHKAAQIGADAEQEVSAQELDLINAYTRRRLSADEVYVFSLVLCDNDVDRDGERFTVESLFALEKLFVGKTGIFDHIPSAKNQTARIFSCKVENLAERRTATGDEYFRLKARAYMPKTEDNRALRDSIDSGIIKEISVGCAVKKTLCSICGKELSACSHQKGELYGGRLCCGELCDPTDAYEWSFVAVPAQKEAGVTKSVFGKEETMENILKKLESKSGFTLSGGDCEKLLGYINTLKQSAKDGVYYRESLTAEVLRLSAAVQPDISRDTMESIAKTMSVAQLKEFRDAFEKQKQNAFAPKPQLCGGKKKTNTESFGQFTI
ncbi:MAG: hypothetical protein IIZ23_03835 [Ruminococcus sp.]|nr:hypothetical protein [Ruminococcus sp.]